MSFDKSFDFFTRMVDELALSKTQYDLTEEIKWIENLAKEAGTDVYQIIFDILYRKDKSIWIEKLRAKGLIK